MISYAKLQIFPSPYTVGHVKISKIREAWAHFQTQRGVVTSRKLSSKIFLGWNLMWTASSSRNLISAVSPTWCEHRIKRGRCCRCCRSALGRLARWASFNAGTVKWVRDFSVLATPLAASLERLHQQGLLKDASVTAAGMPLLCPLRMGHGSHQHYSYTGLGSRVPPGSSNGPWIRGAPSQLGYRCCHGLYIVNVLQNIYIHP